MPELEVVELAVTETYGLRKRVLRDGTPFDDVTFPEDDLPGTFHLGIRDERGEVIAIATFIFGGTEWRPGQAAAQLRGMAVDPTYQGRGVGALVLARAADRLADDGVEVLWAWARDSALGFYERLGMQVVGEGWVSTTTALPHHTVVIDLADLRS